MKPTKEEKLIALATLIGLGRSIEILKSMDEAESVVDSCFTSRPVKRTRKILRPSP